MGEVDQRLSGLRANLLPAGLCRFVELLMAANQTITDVIVALLRRCRLPASIAILIPLHDETGGVRSRLYLPGSRDTMLAQLSVSNSLVSGSY
jgi:hypothetical protein